METFLSFDITEGAHEIKMVYVSLPFYGGLAITTVGIGLFVLLIVLEKKKGFKVIPVREKAADTDDANESLCCEADIQSNDTECTEALNEAPPTDKQVESEENTTIDTKEE